MSEREKTMANTDEGGLFSRQFRAEIGRDYSPPVMEEYDRLRAEMSGHECQQVLDRALANHAAVLVGESEQLDGVFLDCSGIRLPD